MHLIISQLHISFERKMYIYGIAVQYVTYVIVLQIRHSLSRKIYLLLFSIYTICMHADFDSDHS